MNTLLWILLAVVLAIPSILGGALLVAIARMSDDPPKKKLYIARRTNETINK